MPVPPPPGALTVAFRQQCMRCVRAKGRKKDGDPAVSCVWSLESSKCERCVAQHATCVPISWFAGPEYQKLLAAEAATPPVPAAIKAAAAEIGRVVTLATANMPKFRSPAELSAYMESCALRAAVEDGLERVRQAVAVVGQKSALILVNQEKEIAALDGVASAVDAVGELVERIPDALAAAAKVGGGGGKKRKRGAEEVEEEGVAVDLG
ncbi:hypothetical protein V499_08983, partial [Pseudogymnoascus sp. VKM F-103]